MKKGIKIIEYSQETRAQKASALIWVLTVAGFIGFSAIMVILDHIRW